MKVWLMEFWTDPARFRAIMRSALVLLGEFFRRGVIPTGVEGGGETVAAALLMVAVAIPAGDKNEMAAAKPAA